MPDAADRRPPGALALLAAAHPGPAVVVTLLATVLAVAVGAPVGTVLIVFAAIGAGQLSIGFSNDWFDAERDAEAQRSDKPIVRGWVLIETVRLWAVWTAIAAILLSFLLSIAAGTMALALLVSGWAYNVRLKSTPLSVLPYIVGFGALPGVATLALNPGQWPAWWASAIAALLGASAHFANVIPDLADDAATGVRGLPHRLGRTGSAVAAVGLLVAAGVVGVLGPLTTDAEAAASGPTLPAVIGFGATLAIAVAVVWALVARRPERIVFRLVMAAALVQAVTLVVAGASIAV